MVLSGQELHAIEKMAAAGHGQQEDRDHAGLAAVDDEAVVLETARRARWCRTTLGDHMRRLVCV